MAHRVLKVKTTLEIDEFVLQRLREEAERRKTTISDLADGMLLLGLAMPEPVGSASKALPRFLPDQAEVSGSISPIARRFIKCQTKRECRSSIPMCSSMPSTRIRRFTRSAAIWCRGLAGTNRNRSIRGASVTNFSGELRTRMHRYHRDPCCRLSPILKHSCHRQASKCSRQHQVTRRCTPKLLRNTPMLVATLPVTCAQR